MFFIKYLSNTWCERRTVNYTDKIRVFTGPRVVLSAKKQSHPDGMPELKEDFKSLAKKDRKRLFLQHPKKCWKSLQRQHFQQPTSFLVREPPVICLAERWMSARLYSISQITTALTPPSLLSLALLSLCQFLSFLNGLEIRAAHCHGSA
jgi:hypothetical protein